MTNRIQAVGLPDLTQVPAGFTGSTKMRSLSGLALACLLLAGCAGAGGSPPLASDQTSPKPVPAEAQAAAAGPAATSAPAIAAAPVVLQRRRQAIARMLEGTFAFRTLYNLKLVDAKLAGPFEYKERAIFTGATWTSTLYCASARLDVPSIIPNVKTAVIRVKELGNGSERLNARAPSPFECADAKYGPFPELEQLRAQRRAALGKAD